MPYSASEVVKSELAGEVQIAHVDVTTDAAIGNVTIPEYGSVQVIGVELLADPSTTCAWASALVDGAIASKINIKLWMNDPVAGNENTIIAATTFTNVRVTFLGISR